MTKLKPTKAVKTINASVQTFRCQPAQSDSVGLAPADKNLAQRRTFGAWASRTLTVCS